ncbi:MAG: RNA-binding protein [Methanomicrobiales archaeon]|nr:RNA-binding protein [Methanomicrobiales archaeon]
MADIIIKKRHSIRKDEMAQILKELERQIGEGGSLFLADRVEKVETDSPFTLYLLDRQPLLMKYRDWVFPTLKGALAIPFPQRQIIVDQGAIRFLMNGADVMRPGIRSVTDDVRADAPALIVEEVHKKPIAVGIALHDADEIRRQSKGKMCKTIHYVGDPLWRMEI